MSDLLAGMLVRHASLGVGKVVAVEPNAVHVFFPESEKRFAAKLRLPGAKALLTTEAVEPDAWLAGLTSFALDATSGRYALAANWLTHEQAVAEFLAVYPQGFADPTYAGTASASARRGGAPRAPAGARRSATVRESGWSSEGEIDALVRRIAAIEPLTTLFAGALEEDGIRRRVRGPAASRLFFDALFGLLSVPIPSRARFDKLFSAAAGLGVSPSSSLGARHGLPVRRTAAAARRSLAQVDPRRGGAARLRPPVRPLADLEDVCGAEGVLGANTGSAEGARRQGLRGRRRFPARHRDAEAARRPGRRPAGRSLEEDHQVNDGFKDLKGRIRKLEEMLVSRGHVDVDFAQAVSRVRRAVRHGDRSREPTPELRGLLERAETLAHKNV